MKYYFRVTLKNTSEENLQTLLISFDQMAERLNMEISKQNKVTDNL